MDCEKKIPSSIENTLKNAYSKIKNSGNNLNQQNYNNLPTYTNVQPLQQRTSNQMGNLPLFINTRSAIPTMQNLPNYNNQTGYQSNQTTIPQTSNINNEAPSPPKMITNKTNIPSNISVPGQKIIPENNDNGNVSCKKDMYYETLSLIVSTFIIIVLLVLRYRQK